MSRKQINSFVKDLQKLADRHDIRIGFITVDDGKHQVCSCVGLDSDDELLNPHLESLKMALSKLEKEE